MAILHPAEWLDPRHMAPAGADEAISTTLSVDSWDVIHMENVIHGNGVWIGMFDQSSDGLRQSPIPSHQ